ncbi:hypothetical protein EJB05_02434, partial [Eragrostis curvula]
MGRREEEGADGRRKSGGGGGRKKLIAPYLAQAWGGLAVGPKSSRWLRPYRLRPIRKLREEQKRGFMSPEFWEKGQWSRQYDVYSFGKLILMIIIEQEQYSATTDHGDIVQYVWDHWSAGTLNQILQNFAGEEREQAHTCVHIALLCLQRDRKLRPAMGRVGRVLDCLNFDVMLEKPHSPGSVKYTRPNIPSWNVSLLSQIQMIHPTTQDEGTSGVEEIK